MYSRHLQRRRRCSFLQRRRSSFCFLFNTVPLHSLKHNSQRLNRRNRGLVLVTGWSKKLILFIGEKHHGNAHCGTFRRSLHLGHDALVVHLSPSAVSASMKATQTRRDHEQCLWRSTPSTEKIPPRCLRVSY